jgi:serine/threonine protein kinase
MRIEQLRRLRDLLARGGGPEAVFMSLRDRSLQGPALQRALGEEMRRWLADINPERFGGNPEAQDLARKLQRELAEIYAQALLRVGPTGSQPTPLEPDVRPPPEADSRAPVADDIPWGDHRDDSAPARPVPAHDRAHGLMVDIDGAPRLFSDRLADGDLAELWCSPGSDGDPCVAKVAIDATDNDLIFNEAEALQRLHAEGARQTTLLPRLHARFFTRDGRAGNLLGLVEGFTGPQLRERLPAGVPPEHAIWIGRRLLSVVGFAHKQGLLHGNIEPAHIIVRPRDHRVVLIDWCYTVVEPGRTGQGFRAIHDTYSAPEVAQRGRPTPAADLLSIGRTLAFLLGADPLELDLGDHVPDPLQRFIRYLARPSPLQRAQDAWEAYFELERVRDTCFGPHVFREFVV